MKNKVLIQKTRCKKLERNKERRRKKILQKRKRKQFSISYFNSKLQGDYSYQNIIENYLSKDVKHMLFEEKSYFSSSTLYDILWTIKSGVFIVPKIFSIIDNSDESYAFIRKFLCALIYQPFPQIKVDYSECDEVDLASQVLMDIIQKDMIKFYKLCSTSKKTKQSMKKISGYVSNEKSDIKKMLFSVGSPAILSNISIQYPDIVPYKLCIHNREGTGNIIKIMEKKEIDTTELVDYVIDSLGRLNKTLNPDKIDDLCTVIGEILINAEEHSTIGRRFSIGYFQEIDYNEKHCGVFRLVILNFGKTIYEKFKDPKCANKYIVSKMKGLSKSYTGQGFFRKKTFEEETLWTLYSLQEGVTSIAPEDYKKRGHGSIQFIESFFNMKGKHNDADSVSKMTILSGNTSISFDGTYSIVEDITDGEQFKKMTFNASGRIEDKPDNKFVKFVDNYFPGTIISAKILFNGDDIEVL